MFNPSSVNVLGFDPHQSRDEARAYAGKYCSKPEKLYFMATQDVDGVKTWLRTRTTGLPLAITRRFNFHVIRSTFAVVWTPSNFVQAAAGAWQRTPEHLSQHPGYPDPAHLLSTLRGLAPDL